jgi:hypothetical protein
MPLDPNIILNSGRGVTPMRRTNNALRNKTERESSMRSELSQPGADVYAILMRNGEPGLAQEYLNNRQAYEKGQGEAGDAQRKRDADQGTQNLVKTRRGLIGVTDQASWTLFRQDAISGKWSARAGELPKQYSSESVQAMLAQVERMMTDPKARAPDQTLVEIADPTSPTGTRWVPRAKASGQPGKPASGSSLSVGSDGSVSYTTGPGAGSTPPGNIPLVNPVVNATQKDLVALEDSLVRMTKIAEGYNKNFLTYQGRLQLLLARNLDKLGRASPAQRKLIKDSRHFSQDVDREFNSYRKAITGAAAAVQELESLKDAVINTDLGPAEFEAAFETYLAELQRGIEIKRGLLRNGIDVSSPKFGDAFDSQFIRGNSPNGVDVETRGLQPRKQGMDPRDVVIDYLGQMGENNPEPDAVLTGEKTPDGHPIYRRPDGSTFAVQP